MKPVVAGCQLLILYEWVCKSVQIILFTGRADLRVLFRSITMLDAREHYCKWRIMRNGTQFTQEDDGEDCVSQNEWSLPGRINCVGARTYSCRHRQPSVTWKCPSSHEFIQRIDQASNFNPAVKQYNESCILNDESFTLRPFFFPVVTI